MAKLTDTQLIVLSKAATRDDGFAIVPPNLNKAAASKVGASLVARKLMREVKAKPGVPVWREDADARPYSLLITSAGRKAIGVDDEAEAPASSGKAASSAHGRVARVTKASTKGSNLSGAATPCAADARGTPRTGSKQALVIGLLSAKAGTTINALVDATGWLPHTTRAALTGLRKKGLSITRERQQGKVSIYRIVARSPATAASS